MPPNLRRSWRPACPLSCRTENGVTSGTKRRSRVKRGLFTLLVFIAGTLSGAYAFHIVTKAPADPPALPSVEAPPPPPIRTPPVAGNAPSAAAMAPPASAPAPVAPVPTVLADQPRKGTLLIPVLGVTPSQLSDTFNETRGGKRMHEALDILAARGTPVIAADDGRIVKLFNSVPGGLTIYQFDPTERLAYYYAHLDRYAADMAEGMQVKRGEVIAYVGSTGNANPATPHLHFAIFELGPEKRWWKGTAINPYPLLTGR
ncbi:MAG: M23 family metallopeptidase [Candidatus Parcubacteria bacterium]|nr:M23 family metallopeptidase [Burkholderiales bacterium]